MNRVGIQLKPDHPLLQEHDYYGGVRLRLHSVAELLGCFAAAYNLKPPSVDEMYHRGLILIRKTDDGSVWVEFVSELSVEEGSQALNAMRRFGV